MAADVIFAYLTMTDRFDKLPSLATKSFETITKTLEIVVNDIERTRAEIEKLLEMFQKHKELTMAMYDELLLRGEKHMGLMGDLEQVLDNALEQARIVNKEGAFSHPKDALLSHYLEVNERALALRDSYQAFDKRIQKQMKKNLREAKEF